MERRICTVMVSSCLSRGLERSKGCICGELLQLFLSWDTVWLKGKTLHSLVLVGTAAVFLCHFHAGFEAWCLQGTVVHVLQCSRGKCETQQWWLWEHRLLGGRFAVFRWCILLFHGPRPAGNIILNIPWSLPQGTDWAQGCSNEKWYKQ